MSGHDNKEGDDDDDDDEGHHQVGQQTANAFRSYFLGPSSIGPKMYLLVL